MVELSSTLLYPHEVKSPLNSESQVFQKDGILDTIITGQMKTLKFYLTPFSFLVTSKICNVRGQRI